MLVSSYLEGLYHLKTQLLRGIISYLDSFKEEARRKDSANIFKLNGLPPSPRVLPSQIIFTPLNKLSMANAMGGKMDRVCCHLVAKSIWIYLVKALTILFGR